MVSRTYPHGDYKANWSYRWYLEKEKWKRKYPTYEILISSRERMRPYNKKEIEIIISMKKEIGQIKPLQIHSVALIGQSYTKYRNYERKINYKKETFS